MKITEKYITKNASYKNGNIKVKKLMLHSVGTSQPKADVFYNVFNKPNYYVSVHAFIDANTGEIIQTLEWDKKAWHCGGIGNDFAIGVEMCESDAIKYTSGGKFRIINKKQAIKQAKTAYNSAVGLFAYLCDKYGLNPLKSILSHREGYKQGIASNHGDPEHYWQCLGLDYTMDKFRNDVKLAMKSENNIEPENVGETFLVKISTEVLNVRKSPNVNSDIVTTIKKGEVYTIVDTKNGWGKLKSGAGWINLKYIKKEK